MSARAFRPGATYFPVLWSLVLAALMLGPALAPGYVLLRDMVWVPDLSLGRPDVLGFGSALPRAVPSDAVVAALDELVGAMVVQKVLLLAALVGAGAGAAAMVGGALPGRLVAATVAIWNPFVVERLGLGHWPILLGWAALPWLVIAARRINTGSVPLWLPAVVMAGSLNANAALVSAVTLAVCVWAGRPEQVVRSHRVAWLITGATVVALNAPWWVAGLLRTGTATTAGGFVEFRTGGDALPSILSVLTLGGVWNSAVVPDSRTGVLAWIGLLLLLLGAVLGCRRWWRSTGVGERAALIVLWVLGLAIAWASAVASGVLASMGWIPGIGLLRDGSRSLALTLPLIVAVAAAAVTEVEEWLRSHGASVLGRSAAVVGAVLVPLALLPDAGWGIGGQLRAVDYPRSWIEARQLVTPGHGTAVVVPLGNFRAPAWNHSQPVIDPLGRMLRVDTAIDDRLWVGNSLVEGESPLVGELRDALATETPQSRADGLRAAGVGWVLRDPSTDPERTAPVVAGQTVLDQPDLQITRLVGEVAPRAVSHTVRWGQSAAWLIAGVALVIQLPLALRRALMARAARRTGLVHKMRRV